MTTTYRAAVILPDPPRCSICGLLKRNRTITVQDYEGSLVCDRCVIEAARGARMVGDSEDIEARGKPSMVRTASVPLGQPATWCSPSSS